MANEIYSSSWWGEGVCTNTIDWGSSYKALANCTPTPDPFTNTYSLSMDGVDDYVIAPLDGTSTGGILAPSDSDVELTISFWFKLNAGANPAGVFQWANSLSDGTPFLLLQQNLIPTNVKFVIDGGFRTPINVNLSQWYNMTLTRTASDNTWRAYLDGVEVISYDDGGTITNRASATDIYLGNGYGGYSPCNIDEVAVFNKVLTPTEISEIYNSGVPNDLTSLNPVAWYRMGDNGTFKSPQWLIPENSNVANSRFSNYSFLFDGVDDYIPVSGSIISSAGDMTISSWANFSSLAGVQGIFDSANFYRSGFNGGFSFRTIGTNLDVAFSNGTVFSTHNASTGLSTSGGWYHLAFTFNNTTKLGTFYLNGSSIDTYTFTGFDNADLVNGGVIGRAVRNNSYCFTGSLDEISIFNSIVDVATLYNSGEPADISSLSPVGYWRMGEDATFVYNINPEGTWTIPDQVGSNDGISNNTFLDTGRVGDAPNSTSNALSYNMDEVDRESDTPS